MKVLSSAPGAQQQRPVPSAHHASASRARVRARVAAPTSPVTTAPGTTQPALEDLIPQSAREANEVSRNSFCKAFQNSLYQEYSYEVTRVEGTIPAGLKGTFLRNGPGLFEIGNTQLPHPFDGDGMICALAFDGEGRAFFKNKYVRTEGFVAEQRAGVQMYRSAFNRGAPEGKALKLNLGPFGEIKLYNPFDILSVKDVANTTVLHWAGKILAMNEAGLPHALTDALETVGIDKLDSSVTTSTMAAHYRIITEKDGSRRLIMFATAPDGVDAGNMTLYEYDSDFKLAHKTSIKLPGAAFGFFHDIAVTDSYYVVIQNPVRMDFVKLLTQVPAGTAAIAECLEQVTGQAPLLHLVARPGKGRPAGEIKTYPVLGRSFFTFHHMNAYETEDGRHVVADMCTSQNVDFSVNAQTVDEQYFADLTKRTDPTRLVVDLKAPVGPTAVTRYTVLPQGAEMPIVNPVVTGKPYSHCYMVCSPIKGGTYWGPNQAVIKLTVDPTNGVGRPFDTSAVSSDMWVCPSKLQVPGEPVFVSRGGEAEDDGWLLTWVYDAETITSHLAILDAQNLSQGPVARVYLDNHHIPSGLHGTWTDTFLGPIPNRVPHDIRQGV